jgi:predicted Zn-dependent protease
MKLACNCPHKLSAFFISILLFSFHLSAVLGPARALSIEDEQKMGEKFLANVRQHFDFVEDDFANEYINSLGQHLIRPLETKHFPFRFYIIRDHDMNAFAGPGGHIFLFSGLIQGMDGIDELSAVICHEIGHVAARHLSQRIEQSKKIGLATLAGVLAGVLIGGEATNALVTGSVAAGMQKQLSYSRDDERQADQLGFKYMEKSGFDPSGMITTLKNIQRSQWIGTGSTPPYLLTHPAGPERMSNIETLLSGYMPKPENGETAKLRKSFPFFKTILTAKYLEARDAEKLLQRELDKDPGSVSARFGMGILCKERAEYPMAIEHFQRALKEQPDSLPILRNLGEAYQLKGQDGEAVAALEKALNLDDQDKGSLFLLAKSHQALEEYRKAIRLYKRLTFMEPVNDDVFHNLGVCYGREDRLAPAHYNFGLYFKRLGRVDKALFHFNRANDFSKNDPAMTGLIRKAMEDLPSK